MISEPRPSNDRGFLLYAGGPIATSYGHEILVQESSAAEGPHVWLFIKPPSHKSSRDPHLSLEQAVHLRAALDQFIEGVPGRWDDGAERLAEAKRNVLGEG